MNAPAVVLLHTVALAGTMAAGVGDTLTVKERAAPRQVAVGVTVITAVLVVVPLLVAVNEGIAAPDPDAAKPTDVLELVQVKVVPESVLLNGNAPAVAPLHTVVLAGSIAVGDGVTLTVNDLAVPAQVAAVGVTEITAVAVTEPVLMAVKAEIVPDPDAARPMDGLELLHA